MDYPNLIIGGAPKCGTSSLYFWLSAHPEVYGSKVKETYFFDDIVSRFNEKLNYIHHPLEAYQAYFKHNHGEKILFEATAGYIYTRNAIEGLKKLPEPPKIIFSFREPSKMIFSHYNMMRHRLRKTNESFESYVQTRDHVHPFVQYHDHLNRWLQEFDKDLIKVILFEDLVRNKKDVMKDICSFLDIDPGFYESYDFQHRNESVKIRSSWIHKIGLKVQPWIPHFLQKKLLHVYMNINSTGKIEVSDQDREIMKRLKMKYAYVGESLNQLIPDLPLELWK